MNVANVHSCRGCHLLVLSNVAAAPLQRRPRPTIHWYAPIHKICSLGIRGTRHFQAPPYLWSLLHLQLWLPPAGAAGPLPVRLWKVPHDTPKSQHLKIYESHESPIAEKSPDLGFQPQPLLLWSWPWFLRPEESRNCLQNAEREKAHVQVWSNDVKCLTLSLQMTSMILGPPLGWSWSVERFASLHNHLLLEIPEGYRWSNGTSLAMIATLRFTENIRKLLPNVSPGTLASFIAARICSLFLASW